MIVADTNLVSYLLIEGERTAEVRQVWSADPDWILPSLWRSEFLNVLTTAHRAGVLSRDQAMLAWERAVSLFDGHEADPVGERVLLIAIEKHISAYDAQFVAIAEELGVPLVTADVRLATRCHPPAHLIESFLQRR